ncbi:MAG: Spy/CpxP family protein refolding chaperone [Terriglobia bacterium]
MKRWALAGVMLALGLFSLAVIATAQRGEEGGPWGRGEHGRDFQLLAMLENERVKTELGLTDEQTDRLRQIMVDAKKNSVRTRADISVRGIELREMLRADKPDREAVMKKVQEISDLRGQIMRQHVESLLAAKTVLTPEQQKKMRAFLEHRGRPGMRHEGFRPHRPGAPEGAPEPPAPPEPPVQ